MSHLTRPFTLALIATSVVTAFANVVCASGIAGSFTALPSNAVDLTAAGPEQWFYLDSTALPGESKAGSPVTITGAGGSARGVSITQTAPLGLSWSDGTPTRSAAGVHGGIILGPAENSQWGFVPAHVPAGPTSVDLYLSATDAHLTLLVEVGNGTPELLTVLDTPGQSAVGKFSFSFLSSPAPVPLGETVSMTLDLDHAYGPDAAATWQAIAMTPEPAAVAPAAAACLLLLRFRRPRLL